MYLMLEALTGEKPAICNRLSEQEYSKLLGSMRGICGFDQSRLISDITCAELSLLYHTALHNKDTELPMMTVAEAACMLHISVPAVSRTLKNLEKKGFISRDTNQNDRRSVNISVTASGMEVLTANLKKVEGVMNRILSAFTDEELQQMIKLQTKFITSATNVINEIS